MSNKPSIDVQRRRKADKPTGQASAPIRRRPSAAGGGGGGVSRPPSGGLPIPSGGKLGGCGGIIIVILVIGYIILSGGFGGDGGDVLTEVDQPPEEGPVAENLPPSTPRPTRESAPGQSGQNWLVMLYQDADDQILEQDIYLDLNEAERIGSTDRVAVVAQVDRFVGAYAGDGDWAATRRYLVTQDDDLNSLNSELVAEVGEVNMADGSSLVDFVTWAVGAYPADRYVLIMSDHGMGWPGGWSDPQPGGSNASSAPLANAFGDDTMILSEIDQALSDIRQQSGIEKFDLIGMDACLMSQLEVYSALQPHARFAVASEEVEPALGWAYTGFLENLVSNPDMSVGDLAAGIVDTYIAEDQRIVDPQARSDFLRQNSPMGGFFGVQDISADRLAQQIEQNSTLTAVDLEALPALMAAYNDFAYQLQSADQEAVARARSYAQSYTSIFGKSAPPSYIDVGSFIQLLVKESASSAIQQAAGVVLDALGNTIVAEKHGSGKPGSTGIAIYFPNSTMYRSPHTGPQSYNAIADRFVKASLWDDFLAYHYSDRTFSPDAAEPADPGSATRAPGAGDISVSNVSASSSTASSSQPVRISADITGENIGYIYLFVGYYDAQSNSIYVADTDYLESPDTQESSGVYYPVWPEAETFTINFEWDTSLFAINDGSTSTLALFNPVTYGASAETAVYSVNGTYTFADTGEQRYAQLHFIDGKLARVLGFKGQDDTGAPWEITPTPGDSFTLQQRWMDLDANGKVTEVVYQDGETLTFTGNPLEWEAVYAPSGGYVVGFLASDLDGNLSEGYTQVTVP